jgi:septum site-determining protein MinC
MAITDAQAIRFRGRSYFALTLTPEAPLSAWLTRLDACLARSPGFFGASPVILDLQGLELAKADALNLVGALAQRGLRILGLDGAKVEWTGADLPPHIASGRQAHSTEPQTPGPTAQDLPEPVRKPVAQLIIEEPVRSGQCVTHAHGDVIVIGSVGSGAEIIAAGSIHIYGALRGRAMAGAYGDESARIFCRKLEAELIAINGLYQTADEIDARMRFQPAQIRLAGGAMRITSFE